ncbi:MAG: hypothetical protein GF333_03525 [Candidatus Omnitrophica bacterium]|nr:hypothetical protein [Candidatus Omnitrophota bacterium]
MVRADTRERENGLLDCIVESYIRESRPISSSYLCEKYRLPYSSATVRNVMERLEEKGLLSHVHVSSGRVPTQRAFKQYVDKLKEEERDYTPELPVEIDRAGACDLGLDESFHVTLDMLAEASGYTSLIAYTGQSEKFIFRGTRYILEQPEFEDLARLRNVLYALEVKMQELHRMLFQYVNERVAFVIGDDIGFEEIADCSLVISGTRGHNLSFALAILGPMRMDYIKAASCVYSVNTQVRKMIEEML